MSDEWCPHCNLEVEIDPYVPSDCPSCSMKILPCSTCNRFDEMGKEVKPCDWNHDGGCWRFK